METEKTRIAILGGGIAGVVLARELARSGRYHVEILERNPALGGIHRSVEHAGAHFDVGTFVFPMDSRLFRAFPEIEPLFGHGRFDPDTVRRPGSIDRYPLTIKGYAADFGWATTCLDLAGMAAGKAFRFRKRNLPEFIRYHTGGGFYVRAGLKGYIERLFQLEDERIDLRFARQRLEYLENYGIRRTLRRLASTSFRGREDGDPARCRVRPEQGFGQAYSAIADCLAGDDVRIRTGYKMQKIERRRRGFLIDSVSFDEVVSTIPIPALAEALGAPIRARFEYAGLATLFYRFRGEPAFRSAVLFNYSPDSRWKRITLFSRYYGLHAGEHYFSVECIPGKGNAEDEAGLRRDFEDHAAKYRLFPGELKYQGCARTPNAYPIFHASESDRLAEARRDIEARGIRLVGRQGTFDYLSSEQTCLEASRMAHSILAESRPRALAEKRPLAFA